MEKNEAVNLNIQVNRKLRDQLAECAKREKRTMRAIVELALEDYFRKSLDRAAKGEL